MLFPVMGNSSSPTVTNVLNGSPGTARADRAEGPVCAMTPVPGRSRSSPPPYEQQRIGKTTDLPGHPVLANGQRVSTTLSAPVWPASANTA